MCETELTAEEKRAEMLMKLLEEDRKSFNNRRAYEWKLSFAVWTALAILLGLVLQGKVHPGPWTGLLILPAVLVLWLHWYANVRIKLANDVDKREADMCARILLSRAISDDERSNFGKEWDALQAAIEEVKDGKGRWAVRFHVGTTFLLLVAVAIAFFAPGSAKPQGTPAPANVGYGNIIAALTLLVCVIGSFCAWRALRKMTDTNRCADLTGRFEHVFAGPIFYVVNHHRCGAEDIRVYLDDIELASHPNFPEQQTLREQIGPNGVHTYQLNVSQSTGYPETIRITWNDKSGKPGEFRGGF